MKVGTRALSGLLALVCAVPVAALDTVFVVRHAQKDEAEQWGAFAPLRPLSHKGAVCAGRLAERLAGEGVAAVYATETARTLATGAAVSSQLDEAVIFGDSGQARPSAEFVGGLRNRHREDRAILLVGHSNTVTDIVVAFRPEAEACLERLGLGRPGISEARYGDLWRVELESDTAACEGAVQRSFLGDEGGIDCATP